MNTAANGRHPATLPAPPRQGRSAPELMTVKDVAQALGFHQRTVWRWVKEGIFPPPLMLGVSRR